MLLLLSAACAAGCADDKEEGGSDIKLNPDPTQLSNITLMKATFAADEFNMISEPGFEFFPDEAIDYRSGDKVRVTGGPFKGAEGYIKRIRGNRRLIVALEGVIAVATTYIPGCFLEKTSKN